VAEGVGVDSGGKVGVLVGVGVDVGLAPHPDRDKLSRVNALRAIVTSATSRAS
jgi:hypothetical protein